MKKILLILLLSFVGTQFLDAQTSPDIQSIVFAPRIICQENAALISISGSKGDATHWSTYAGSCGGTLVGTTTTSTEILVPVAGSNTFYVMGEGGSVWTDMANAFEGCTNLNITNANINSPDLSIVTSLANMFSEATNFNSIISVFVSNTACIKILQLIKRRITFSKPFQ